MDFDPSRWMANLAPEVRVIDSYIPASHDASAYPVGNAADPLKWALGAVTQSANYTGQLAKAGSRYFDMRITKRWSLRGVGWGELMMHHSEVNFQPLSAVLDQIIDFVAGHPTETIFMDLDFTGNVQNDVMSMLLEKFGGEGRFTNRHVVLDSKGRSHYNTFLTWGELAAEAKAGRNFVIIWQAGQPPKSPRLWAPPSDAIRDDPYEDFDEKSPQEILNFLTVSLNGWEKKKLMLTQLINTPKFSPFSHPQDKDRSAAALFNPWLMSHPAGSKLNVVKRDFVNGQWNKSAIAYVINLNKWAPNARVPRSIDAEPSPVLYCDWVRIKSVDDGRYVALSVFQADSGVLCVLRTTSEATPDTNFIVRENSYTSRAGLQYSGNPDADTVDASGNLRFVHVDTRDPPGNVGDNYVLAHYLDRDSQIVWGTEWAAAGNSETFLPFNVDDVADTGEILYGSPFVLRSSLKRFWRVVYCCSGPDAEAHVFANADISEATLWEFEMGVDPRL